MAKNGAFLNSKGIFGQNPRFWDISGLSARPRGRWGPSFGQGCTKLSSRPCFGRARARTWPKSGHFLIVLARFCHFGEKWPKNDLDGALFAILAKMVKNGPFWGPLFLADFLDH